MLYSSYPLKVCRKWIAIITFVFFVLSIYFYQIVSYSFFFLNMESLIDYLSLWLYFSCREEISILFPLVCFSHFFFLKLLLLNFMALHNGFRSLIQSEIFPWFIPQWARLDSAETGVFHPGCKSASICTIFSCFIRHVRGKLHQKLGSRDLWPAPWYRMVIWQA